MYSRYSFDSQKSRVAFVQRTFGGVCMAKFSSSVVVDERKVMSRSASIDS